MRTSCTSYWQYSRRHTLFIDSLEERVRIGEALAPFLRNEVIKQLFRDLDRDYWKQLKTEISPTEREVLLADARALERLAKALAVLVESGAAAKAQLEPAAQVAGH